MKNLVLAVGVSVLALAGCDNNANAQAQQVSADVGSPQGNNTLIIEEGYTVVDPVQPVQPSGAIDVNNQMQPLDVAPLPEGNQPAALPNAGDAVLIQETISSTTTQPMQ